MEPFDRLKAINDLKESKTLEAKRHNDIQLSHLKTQETILEVFKSFADYLDKRVSKTEVVNQLKSINTPDSMKVAAAVDQLHDTLKTHENTDLSEITSVMKALLTETEKIPKDLPVIPETKTVDYSVQFKSLQQAVKSVEDVVKAQKFIAEAPIVNVPEATVHVDAPDLEPLQTSIKDVVAAVGQIIIPEYKTDNKAVEQLVKKSNDLLKKLLDKPVGSGGGGGASSWAAINPAGIPMPLNLDADGKLIVAASVVVPPITTEPTFKLDPSDTGEAAKYGHVDAQGDLQVDVLSSALPIGAATAAKQLADNHQVTVSNQVDQPLEDGGNVVVASSALPTGAATAVNQTNGGQLTQIVDDDGNKVGTETIGSQVYLNAAIVQDIEISTTNSSTSNINAGVTFTGTTWSTLGAASVQITLFADQNCTISVQQSQEDPGVNWDLIDSWAYTASSGGSDAARTIQATGSSFRVRVTNNGPSATTVFRLQSLVTPYADALPRGLSQQGNLKIALEELNSTDISVGNGTSDLGTQRVAIASDNDPVPVMAGSLPLPSGASTSALQGTANASLSSIDSKLSGTLTAAVTGSVGSTSGVVNVNQKAVNISAVQLNVGSVVPTNGILVGALSTNSAPIFIGGSGVTTTNGAELLAGASLPFTCNLNTLYIISVASTTDRVWWDVA